MERRSIAVSVLKQQNSIFLSLSWFLLNTPYWYLFCSCPVVDQATLSGSSWINECMQAQILCSRTSPSSHFLIAISHMNYIGGNDKHTFEQGLLPQFTITKLFTHNHASNNILQYQTPLLAALWFDSENLEFIMWQNRNSWNFSHQFILAWFLECDTFCMALQGFSVLIS